MAQTPATSAFDWVGGEAAVRQLVDRFYDLMDLEGAYAALRAVHPATLDGSRDKLHWFLFRSKTSFILCIGRAGFNPKLTCGSNTFAL